MKKISFEKEEKIIIGIIIFLCLISFFLDEFIKNSLFYLRNIFFDYVLATFSLTFSLFLPLMLLTSLFLYLKNKKEGILPLWVSFIVTYLVVYSIKFIVHRPRMIGEMIIPLINIPDYSFPSAHAALSFAILAVIDEEFRKLKIAWLIIALLIAFSRIYFSYHYFSDVIFGALIGYGIGLIITKKLGKQENQNSNKS